MGREIDGRTATPHHPRQGGRQERSSVKPLIMPKQYTVGAPVSVPSPLEASPIKISSFENEFELEAVPAD